MRARSAILLALTGLLLLSACGRKDVPAYPPDAIVRPGHAPDRNAPVRY